MSATASHHARSDGFIVVAVLWIIAALATMATIYSVYLDRSSFSFAESGDRLRAEAAIDASLSLTSYQLSVGTSQMVPTHGAIEFQLGPALVSARFVNEAARIDLNAADPVLLAGLFRTLGETPDNAKAEAQHIVDWRTPLPRGSTDQEAANYRAEGLKYGPRHGPFADVSELWLVRDLPARLVERALPFVTVFNGNSTIDALDARPEVLASLPGMTPDRLQAVEEEVARAPDDVKSLGSILGPLQASALGVSKAVRVFTTVRFSHGGQVNAESVIVPGATAKGYKTLAWTDDLDEPFAGQLGPSQ
jgi:general secretion pathway protein K